MKSKKEQLTPLRILDLKSAKVSPNKNTIRHRQWLNLGQISMDKKAINQNQIKHSKNDGGHKET